MSSVYKNKSIDAQSTPVHRSGLFKKIEFAITDIPTQADMQAVVNTANANLRMGSGVADEIRGEAGSELICCNHCLDKTHLTLSLTPRRNASTGT